MILSSLYEDKTENEMISWLREYGFLEPVRKSVSQLNKVILNESLLLQSCKCLPVGHIACNLLWSINERIRSNNTALLLVELENTMSDVCFALLKEFFIYIRSDKKAIVMQIDVALRDCCEFHNYDYSQLVRLLKIEQGISYFQALQNSERLVSSEIPRHCWKGKPTDKAEFLSIFTEQKLLKSKRGLAKLFENPTEPLNLAFDPSQANLLLQFVYSLKKLKLISPTVVGIYQVLEFHVPEFKKDFLKNQPGGNRVDALKQNKTQWSDNQLRINKWLSPFTR